jgi:hypothetical protein
LKRAIQSIDDLLEAPGLAGNEPGLLSQKMTRE